MISEMISDHQTVEIRRINPDRSWMLSTTIWVCISMSLLVICWCFESAEISNRLNVVFMPRCGYPAVNASYYDLSFHSISSNKDCKLYKNLRTIKCYNCDSCKAGVAQYMKTEWRLVAIFNVVLFVVLISSLLSTRFDSEQSFGLLNGLVQISNITFKDCQTTTVPKQF
jgi:hypothetical protein